MITKTPAVLRTGRALLLFASWAVLISGCSRSDTNTIGAAPATTPQQAATQLEQAFATASPEAKTSVTTATEALRTADYDRAMAALEAVKANKNLTVQQNIALHESEVAMEMRLIQAMESGDPKAKAAYEQWRKRRRD
jgi:hypothetical protein